MSLFGRDYDPYLGSNIKEGMGEIAEAIKNISLDNRLQFDVKPGDKTIYVHEGTKEYRWLISDYPCLDDGTVVKIRGKYYVPAERPHKVCCNVKVYSGTPVEVTSVNQDNDDGAFFTYHKIKGLGKCIDSYEESVSVPIGEIPSSYAYKQNHKDNRTANEVWDDIKKSFDLE